MKFVLFAMIVVAYLATGDAIKCYRCTYPPTEKCGTAFDQDGEGVLSGECDALATRCVKFVNGPNITRSCDVAVDEDESAEEMGDFYCETNLCNGDNSIDAALSTLMVLVSALILGSQK